MINWGRVSLGTVLPFMFTTYDGATGASEEGSGLAVTDIEIYKAGGGLTQRSSDAGYALLDADGHALDSIVGLAGFSVDTGDNTDAGFFVAGGYYIVVVASVTVDTQTVNFIAGTFSLGPTLSVAGVEEVDVTHIGGSAITAASGIPEVKVNNIAANAITAASMNADASAEIADAVWDEDATGHQTGGTFGQAIGDPGASTETLYKAIVTDPAGTNIAADVIAIKAETASILTDTAEIGAAGAGLTEAGGTGDHLTAVPWNAAWDAEVQSEVADALAVYDPPTNAEMEARTLVAANYFDPATDNVSVSNITSAAVGDILLEDIANHEASASARSALWAIAKLVNRIASSGGTLTIYKTNDSSSLFTQVVTSDGAAEPIVELNTA